MDSFLSVFILLPLLGYAVSILIPNKQENVLSVVAITTTGIHLFLATLFIAIWFWQGRPTLDHKDIVLYQSAGYEFFIDFHFDLITATYLMIGSFLTTMVTVYSRYYMHRESGYKRFFNTLHFFFVGYMVAVFSGNLETLFVGWEILGVASFLLIAFYRDRYLPVKNAVKVFSIYRIGDVGLILAMWMSHHLFHENITFLKLNNYELVHEHLQQHSAIGIFISLMVLLSAAAKSAQLPFSSWLPRAMEGPTPSSAIFYGSLAVHLGVFLMLRTYPFWEHQFSVRMCIGFMGFASALVATGIARVQSSVKSQIAYASIAQIGLIFIEVAAGWHLLALVHLAGNAFLRTYQLLVSPSVVSYLIREQVYEYEPQQRSMEHSLPKRLEYALYLLCLKEWNLDNLMYKYLWNPLKWAGRKLDFLTLKRVLMLFVIVYGAGIWLLYHARLQELSTEWVKRLPVIFSAIGLVMILKSFTERRRARMSLTLVAMNHAWIALAIAFNEQVNSTHIALYLSGVVLSWIVGYLCLRRLKLLEGSIDLDRFHGYSWEHPKIAFVFLISCLGMAGFPITPTFIGEDLVFTHIHENQPVLAALTALSLILDGLSIIRIYARVFLGPHVKSVYEMGYRSS